MKATNIALAFHDAANIFPMIDDDSFASFLEDIKAHGVREAVKLLDGMVIDGRNRYKAARDLGIPCPTEDIETDDPVAYVLSMNRHRRHLKPSQLATVAARAREFYDKAAKERQKQHGGTAPGRKMEGTLPVSLPEVKRSDARDAAGKAVGVSGSLVDRGTKVLTQGTPELIKAVDEGRLSVTAAATFAECDEETQKEIAANAKASGGRYRNSTLTADKPETEPKHNGKPPVGVILANEALNVLMRIPKSDPLRKRGFQIVVDWIRTNK